jgi:hypothetical protein
VDADAPLGGSSVEADYVLRDGSSSACWGRPWSARSGDIRELAQSKDLSWGLSLCGAS